MAEKAIKQAKEQNITITEKDLQQARNAIAKQKRQSDSVLNESSTQEQQSPALQPEAPAAFKTADGAIDYALRTNER